MARTDNIDRFFVMHAARSDQWREVLTAAEKWAAGSGNRAGVGSDLRRPSWALRGPAPAFGPWVADRERPCPRSRCRSCLSRATAKIICSFWASVCSLSLW